MLKTSFKILTILNLILLNLSNGATPPFITKCKPDDSDCIKENTKRIIPIFTAKGIPEYGVEIQDPLFIKSVNASQGNLLFLVNDATATGLSRCEPKKVSRDLKRSKILLKIQCTAHLEGQYVLSGSVLVVPLKGNGRILVDLKSAVIDVEFDMIDKIKDDGSKHWFVKSFKYTLDFKDKSNVVFENLYDGNEILGRAAKELVANNGNDIIKEIGQPVISHIIGEVVKNMNHMFKIATVEDLSL